MMRRLVVTISFFLLFSLLFMVSPVGFQLAIHIVKKHIPGIMHFSKIEGNIFGPIRIFDFDYTRQEGQIPVTLHIKTASLTWHLPMLLLGKIDISRLTLEDITVIRPIPITVKHATLTLRGKLSQYTLQINATYKNKNINQNIVIEATGNQERIHFRLPLLGDIQWAPDWRITLNGNATLGQNILHITGGYHQAWNLTWNFESDTIEGKGALKGSAFKEPLITATLQSHPIHYAGLVAESLAARLYLDLSEKNTSQLTVTLQNGTWKGIKAQTIQLAVNAEKQLGEITAHVKLTQANKQVLAVSAKLKGKPHDSIWTGDVIQLNAQVNTLPAWSLKKPAHLTFGPHYCTLENMCVHASTGQICGGGNYQKLQNVWNAWVSGNFSDLNGFSTWLQPELRTNLSARFSTHMQGTLEQCQNMDFYFDTSAGKLSYINLLQTYNLPIKKIQLSGQMNANQITSQMRIILEENNYFTGQIEIPRNHLEKINAQLKLNFSKLQPLELFLPVITNAQGAIIGKFDITGSWAKPEIAGALGIKNGYINIPELRIRLDDINLDLSASHQKIDYNLSARSAQRPIRLIGTARFQDKHFTNTADIIGENLLIFNTGEYNIHASPHLTLQTIDHDTSISGVITIPEAVIKPVDFSTTTSLPDEIEIIGNETEKEKKSIWNTALNIKIILEKNVILKSNGLKGHPVGECTILRTAKQPSLIGRGAVRLMNATFSTQGKVFTITPDSNIHWDNDLITNPRLGINAYRIVTVSATTQNGSMGGKTKVGASVEGTVKQPVVNFFSIPIALPQADIISYLLFDQPTGEGNTTDSLSLLIQAASNLKLRGNGGSFSISQIKQTLGISELGVQQQTYLDALGTPLGINQSSFVIGSYITPKIHLRYNHGILTDINIYQVQYIIDGNWSLQMETYSGSNNLDNSSGLDVLYTISRKKFF